MKLYLAIAYAIPTLIMILAFARYGERSWLGITQWALFYFVTLVQPFYFAHKSLKQFDVHGIPASSKLRRIAFYPVIVGGLALLAGLELLRAS